MKTKDFIPGKNLRIIEGPIDDINAYYGGFFSSANIINSNIIVAGDCNMVECREGFHHTNLNKQNKNQYILFSHINKFLNVKSLVNEIEKILKVPSKQHTKFFNLKPTIMLIKMSDWWNDNEFRQQFFTILLRAGLHYDLKSRTNKKQKIEYTLKCEEYFEYTWSAVELFLQGYNKLKSSKAKCSGWYDTFYYEEDYYDELDNVSVAKTDAIKRIKSVLKK